MRITEEKENGFYKLKKGQEIYGEEDGIRLVQTIGKFEDIEEEFGINLIKLLSAKKVYYMAWNRNYSGFIILESEKLFINLTDKTIEFYEDDYSEYTIDLKIEDYGKKDKLYGWAFTKEELK